MRKFSFLLLVTTLLALNACKTKRMKGPTVLDSPGAQPVGVQFMNSKKLGPVLDQAADENKLVFVDFYTSWCTPCKLMDKDVFPNEALGDFFNDNFISYKVNAEKGNGVNLRTIYEVNLYPTLLFLDTRGRVLVRKEGAAYHTELKRLADQALLLAKQPEEQ